MKDLTADVFIKAAYKVQCGIVNEPLDCYEVASINFVDKTFTFRYGSELIQDVPVDAATHFNFHHVDITDERESRYEKTQTKFMAF